ncbi:ATP-binding protein [Streptomyces sp. NPDC088725]|uniref:ATP-binding protein n=1 Tax=Streptomyces sp. NPDC088725 TaxID=3365873 RepID=UPI003811F86B
MKSETSPTAAQATTLAPLFPPSRIRLSSSRRGARLARLLAPQQLDDWGIPRTASTAVAAVAVVAELAGNAAIHGRTPGRDFETRLMLTSAAVRIEVIDTQPDLLPVAPACVTMPPPDSTGGRGLLLVSAYADRWGWTVRDAYTKAVWAEVDRNPVGAAGG